MKQKVIRIIWMLLFLGVSAYYIWRVFALMPWYDELYTYFYFISRGPIYSAIHWPLPNNHFLYSVLSAIVNYLGNPLLGLRGVSLVCAAANIVLLSLLTKKLLGDQYCILSVCLYAGMDSVNYLAVQGRGYTLATTFYLISLYCLYRICISDHIEKRYYIVFSISLTAGLYTLVSSVYWVIPTCIAGGFILLVLKKKKVLFQLIVASVVAAVNTFIIYSFVWLAIGSNLLQNDPSLATYGEDHLKIILSEPLHAWKCGMDFMAGNPYVQGGIPLRDMVLSFVPYWRNIFNGFYSRTAEGLFFLFFLTILLSVGIMLKRRERSDEDKILSIYLTCTIVIIPLMIFLQRAVPYARVFSFVGVPTVLSALFVVNMILRFFGRKIVNIIMTALSIIGIAILCLNLSSGYYNRAYAGRETEILELIGQNGVSAESKFFLTDDYQELLLGFYYGEYQEVSSVEEADVLMMPQESMENTDMVGWPIYYPYSYFDWKYIEREFEATYKNEGYLLYQRK